MALITMILMTTMMNEKKLLANATHEADKFLTNETFRLNPVVDQWRQAFQQFKKRKVRAHQLRPY